MEIIPKAMEIEYIRIKRFKSEDRKGLMQQAGDAICILLIPLTGYYFFQYLLLLNVITAERPD